MDQQTAMAVQSLLEPERKGPDEVPIDDGDVFQCGKCKSQFVALEAFVLHKRGGCSGLSNEGQVVSVTFTTEPNPKQTSNDAVDSPCEEPNPYSTIGENIVLSEDLLNLATIDGQLQIINNAPCAVPSTIPPQAKTQSIHVVQVSNSGTQAINSQETVSSSNPTFVAENCIDEQPTSQRKPQRRLPYADSSSVKSGKLSCQFCDKKFQKNFDLQQHLRCHTGEKPFQCLVCGRGFAQKSNVKKHMATHKVWPDGMGKTLPKKPILETSLMEVNEDGQIQVAENSEANISIDNSYVCKYCEEKFESFYQLRSHMIKHKDLQVYKCFHHSCGELFKNMEDFIEHTKCHDTDMNYNCQICMKQFSSLSDLAQHQYTHSLFPNQGSKPSHRFFQCLKCKSKYASAEALSHHMETTNHEFECPHCSKVFPCERYLRRHLPLHGTTVSHVCGICRKSFRTEAYLKIHSLIHNDVKPFKCDQCEVRFVRKDHLKRHKITIHCPVKKYVCPFRAVLGCTKAFARQDKLKAHLISHTKKKTNPKKCEECGKQLSSKLHKCQHNPKQTLIKEDNSLNGSDDKKEDQSLRRSKRTIKPPSKMKEEIRKVKGQGRRRGRPSKKPDEKSVEEFCNKILQMDSGDLQDLSISVADMDKPEESEMLQPVSVTLMPSPMLLDVRMSAEQI